VESTGVFAPLLVTSTGRQIDLMDPQVRHVDIRDIAHGLSHICRWGGHTEAFYSVAEHSLLVSRICSDPLWGLLHDATEAYLGDIVRPLKARMPHYRALEGAWQRVIMEALGVPLVEPSDLDSCDLAVALLEAEELMPEGAVGSQLNGLVRRPLPHQIRTRCHTPAYARALFLERWEEVR
jgi:hypothetical protein